MAATILASLSKKYRKLFETSFYAGFLIFCSIFCLRDVKAMLKALSDFNGEDQGNLEGEFFTQAR